MIKLDGEFLTNSHTSFRLKPLQATTLRALALCRPGMVSESALLMAANKSNPRFAGGDDGLKSRLVTIRRALREMGGSGEIFHFHGFGVHGYHLLDDVEVVQ